MENWREVANRVRSEEERKRSEEEARMRALFPKGNPEQDARERFSSYANKFYIPFMRQTALVEKFEYVRDKIWNKGRLVTLDEVYEEKIPITVPGRFGNGGYSGFKTRLAHRFGPVLSHERFELSASFSCNFDAQGNVITVSLDMGGMPKFDVGREKAGHYWSKVGANYSALAPRIEEDFAMYIDGLHKSGRIGYSGIR